MADFALLGSDPLCVALAKAIAGSPSDTLSVAVTEDRGNSGLGEMHAQVARVARWEELLGRDDVAAVVVASDYVGRWQQWRALAERGRHLLISGCEQLPMLAHYELALIAESSGVVLFPLLAARLHPATERLHEWIDGGGRAKLRNLALQRRVPMSSCTLGEPGLPQLHGDADLLRMLAGEFVEVTALASPGLDASEGTVRQRPMPSINVQMAAAGGAVATWTQLAGRNDGASMRLVTDGGSAELEWQGISAVAMLTIEESDAPATQHRYEGFDAGPALLAAFHRAVHSANLSDEDRLGAQREHDPVWLDATRAAELVDAALYSLRRRRAVALQSKQPTEAENFKGTMAAGGCGMLVLAFVLLVVETIGVPWLGFLSYGILGIMGLFLVLQLLRFVLADDKQ